MEWNKAKCCSFASLWEHCICSHAWPRKIQAWWLKCEAHVCWLWCKLKRLQIVQPKQWQNHCKPWHWIWWRRCLELGSWTKHLWVFPILWRNRSRGPDTHYPVHPFEGSSSERPRRIRSIQDLHDETEPIHDLFCLFVDSEPLSFDDAMEDKNGVWQWRKKSKPLKGTTLGSYQLFQGSWSYWSQMVFKAKKNAKGEVER